MLALKGCQLTVISKHGQLATLYRKSQYTPQLDAQLILITKSMSAHQGAPPQMACIDWSIDRACEIGNQYSLPDDMRYHLMMSRFCDRVTKIMSGNNASQLGMPADGDRVLLMNVLEEDLNTMEAQFAGKLSRKLHLTQISLIRNRIF
jgi:hypothetical protein